MYKFYQKNEVLFAVGWILVYCLLIAPLRGEYGDDSVVLLAAMIVLATAIFLFVRKHHLESKYGLDRWPKNTKKYLYFIPMWIAATFNVWDGISLSYTGINQFYACLTMALVGFVEEMLFRGFLFNAMLKDDGSLPSIIVSSLTFGIGHIVNLFSGQAGFDTFVQVIFAISWGFMFTMVYYKGKSLLPCIVAHSLIDVLSLFGADTASDMIYVYVTIIIAVSYCLYLYGIKDKQE